MKAFLLSGSPSEGSHTLGVMDSIAEELIFVGHEPIIWDIAEKPLPEFEPRFHGDQRLVGERAAEFLDQINASSMVVIGTPLYHGSYSGALKNALDYLLKDQLENKPVGLVCNGGITKAFQAISHLVQITQTLYGVPMQTQIATTGSHFSETKDGYELVGEEALERIKRLVTELDKYSELLRS